MLEIEVSLWVSVWDASFRLSFLAATFAPAIDIALMWHIKWRLLRFSAQRFSTIRRIQQRH